LLPLPRYRAMLKGCRRLLPDARQRRVADMLSWRCAPQMPPPPEFAGAPACAAPQLRRQPEANARQCAEKARHRHQPFRQRQRR